MFVEIPTPRSDSPNLRVRQLRARAGEGLTKHLGEAQNGCSNWLEPNANNGHLDVPFRTYVHIILHEKTDMHANMHTTWDMVRVLFTPPASLRPNGQREGRCTRFPSKHVRRPIKSNCCYSQRRRAPRRHYGTIDVACQLNLRLVSETSRPDKAPGASHTRYTSRRNNPHTTDRA